MFPDNVGRVVLDGVMDVPNYYVGELSHNFKSTEEELDKFFDECVNSLACRLAELSSSRPELKNLVINWAAELKA